MNNAGRYRYICLGPRGKEHNKKVAVYAGLKDGWPKCPFCGKRMLKSGG